MLTKYFFDLLSYVFLLNVALLQSITNLFSDYMFTKFITASNSD